jgi:putative restriction endonuclease
MPHKPLLLLVVLEMDEQTQLPATLLRVSPEPAFRFFTFWNIGAGRRTQRPDVRLPFYHLQSDGFWEALSVWRSDMLRVANQDPTTFSFPRPLEKV